MSSRKEQTRQIRKSQRFGEGYYLREVRDWYKSVIAEWKPGANAITKGQLADLRLILRRGYQVQSREILGTNYKQFKQETEPFDSTMATVADELDPEFEKAERETAISIAATIAVFMGWSMAIAEAQTETAGRARDRIARASMSKRARGHSLRIAVTQSNWTTQTTRKTAILAVTDPLKDSVGTIADLIEGGEENLARRVSRSVTRMARLPNSVNQGKLIGFVTDARDRLLTPGAQGRIVAGMRAQAERLEAPEKEWLTRGDAKVRETHMSANHQKRPPDVPFRLSDGDLLQFPMDTSLGAKLSNVVNCRCAALWE